MKNKLYEPTEIEIEKVIKEKVKVLCCSCCGYESFHEGIMQWHCSGHLPLPEALNYLFESQDHIIAVHDPEGTNVRIGYPDFFVWWSGKYFKFYGTFNGGKFREDFFTEKLLKYKCNLKEDLSVFSNYTQQELKERFK